MNTRQKELMYKQIETHGNSLLAIFPNAIEKDAIKLCKKLHTLENKANRLAVDWCNGDITNEQWDVESEKILDKVDKILHFREQSIPVYANGDARGYTLKIKDSYVREHNLVIYKDWGGYGIIAPEFEGR